MNVVAYAPNLMDQSRIRAQIAGVSFVNDPDDLRNFNAEVLIIDLSNNAVFEVLGDLADKNTIGFGSHVDVERMQKAVERGCRIAVPRSRFFARMPEILQEINQ